MTGAFWRSVVGVMCLAAGLLSLDPAARLGGPSGKWLAGRRGCPLNSFTITIQSEHHRATIGSVER
jgi:hypothetical protein